MLISHNDDQRYLIKKIACAILKLINLNSATYLKSLNNSLLALIDNLCITIYFYNVALKIAIFYSSLLLSSLSNTCIIVKLLLWTSFIAFKECDVCNITSSNNMLLFSINYSVLLYCCDLFLYFNCIFVVAII